MSGFGFIQGAGQPGRHLPESSSRQIEQAAAEISVFSSYDENHAELELPRDPTVDTYGALVFAFRYYNETLFGGELPPCLITLQRHDRAYGYFCGNRFADRSDPNRRVCEIAMNPAFMDEQSDEEVLSVFVHEMVHHWQFHFSRYPSRRFKGRGYHDREWVAKMEAVGLIPSNSGLPGGEQVGVQMFHYIEDGGLFQQVTAKLISRGFRLPWCDAPVYQRPPEEPKRKVASSFRMFSCPNCGQKALAKEAARLLCGHEGCDGAAMVGSLPRFSGSGTWFRNRFSNSTEGSDERS